jgi:Leucine-rich repeat (LRR) protein
MEFFIQGRDLNNLKWLCLKKCTMQKLPSNVFHCFQLHILDLSHCLQELFTSIGQLNALQEFNLSYCYRLQELLTSFGQLNVLQELNLSNCLKLQNLPTFIGQLSAL